MRVIIAGSGDVAPLSFRQHGSAAREDLMPDVLVRVLSDKALELLKEQARCRGRSLQAELKLILEQAAQAADVAAARAC